MPYLLMLLVVLSVPAAANESDDPDHAQAHLIPAAVERNVVEIKAVGDVLVITSNGIPNHTTGQFPNRGNPNAISAQSHEYRVALNPIKTGRATKKDGVIGVALNGVPFEPATAECYGQARGQRSAPGACEWRLEAIVRGEGQLGLDQNNAHVQPTGTYHYHGVPHGLLDVLRPYKSMGDLVHVGYAADGFKMMVSRSGRYQSSYQLKAGVRPSAPGGRYDGTYTADFEYRAGSGDLDQCNGTDVNGEYVYFVTEAFPFALRCLMGVVNSSFSKRGGGSVEGKNRRQRPPSGSGHRRPPPHF